MNQIKTIIIDDELKARQGLEKLLNQLDEYELAGICKNGMEAIESINALKPDLVLLDIQMPGVSGFDVLSSITHKPFIIFITAYDQFAIKAFENHAIDYILKPFTDERFHEALSNAKELIYGKTIRQSMDTLYHFINNIESTTKDEAISTNSQLGRLVLRASGKILLIDHHEIRWVEADDYCVKIHAEKDYIINESLKNLSHHLPSQFIRVHKSSIININYLKFLEPIGHSELMAVLEGDIQVKVSRTYKSELMRVL